jgi:hypothetical protein
VEVFPSGTLRFQVTKPKIKWGAYFVDTMRPKFGGGFEDYSGQGPSVVAQNSEGDERVIAVCKKLKEAKDKAAVIESDFKTLGAGAWCERYGVPRDFVT